MRLATAIWNNILGLMSMTFKSPYMFPSTLSLHFLIQPWSDFIMNTEFSNQLRTTKIETAAKSSFEINSI